MIIKLSVIEKRDNKRRYKKSRKVYLNPVGDVGSVVVFDLLSSLHNEYCIELVELSTPQSPSVCLSQRSLYITAIIQRKKKKKIGSNRRRDKSL